MRGIPYLGFRTKKEPEPKLPEFEFEVGHVYNIISRGNTGISNRALSNLDAATGFGCLFRYDGKKGVHHCFTETQGRWSRTYTDVQLIGKKITEVMVDG